MRMEELLIEQVKQHDVLYNTKSFNYKDQHVRQEAWEEIGGDLKIAAETAKKTWNTLRRCFLNAISRRRKKSGEAAKKIIPWKYELQMSFLLPFMDSGKTQSNMQEDTLDELNDDGDNLQEPEIKYNIVNNETSATLETNIMPQEEVSHHLQSLRRNRREIRNNPISQMVGMMKETAFLRKPRHEEWQSREMDDTDMFFFSMAKMTKRLPPLEQAKIKLQLSNAVLQAQIRISESVEQERPPSACSASSSTSASYSAYTPQISIQTHP